MRWMLMAAPLALAACEADAPEPGSDTEPPEYLVVLTDMPGRAQLDPNDVADGTYCAKFGNSEIGITITVSDNGGVSAVGFSTALGGRIIPESLDVRPADSVTTELIDANSAIIRLVRPGPDTVLTGVTIDARLELPAEALVLTLDAVDVSGNHALLPGDQFPLFPANASAVCRMGTDPAVDEE